MWFVRIQHEDRCGRGTLALRRMKRQKDLIATAIVAFAGGFAAGLLCSPASVPRARRAVIRKARLRTEWLVGRLHEVEQHLAALEEQIHATGDQLSHRVHEATVKAVDHFVPSVPDDPSTWELGGAELTRDLRRMPHR